MGWNSLEILRSDPLFRYISPDESVYYVHSFYAVGCSPHTLAVSHYGNAAVPGVVRSGNVYGAQFLSLIHICGQGHPGRIRGRRL